MLNIAICDDDKDFLNNIGQMAKKILKSLNEQASISLYTDARFLIKKLEKYNPYYDIIFLDIDMLAINVRFYLEI